MGCPYLIVLNDYDIEIELYGSSASLRYVLLLEPQAFVGHAVKFHALRILYVGCRGNWILEGKCNVVEPKINGYLGLYHRQGDMAVKCRDVRGI